MSYYDRIASAEVDGPLKKVLLVYANYDLTFRKEYSLQVVDAFKRVGLNFEKRVLPCGHYTTGETPFQYMDGWYMGSFVYRAFKALRSERASASERLMRAAVQKRKKTWSRGSDLASQSRIGYSDSNRSKLRGIEIGVFPANGPVQMRTGYAAGRAAEAELVAGFYALAFVHIDAAEVHRQRVQAQAVIDDDAVAFVVEMPREHHDAAV